MYAGIELHGVKLTTELSDIMNNQNVTQIFLQYRHRLLETKHTTSKRKKCLSTSDAFRSSHILSR